MTLSGDKHKSSLKWMHDRGGSRFYEKGGSNIFDVAKYIGVLEVGGGGGVACMSTIRRLYRGSVILETKIFVI